MNNLEGLFNCFSSIPTSLSERVQKLEAVVQCTGSQIPKLELLQQNLINFPSRDKICIELNTDIDSYCKIYSNEIYADKYLEFLTTVDLEDNINIIISIDKEVQNGILSVYSFGNFVEDLLQKDIVKIMAIFNKLLSGLDHLVFELFDSEFFMMTQTILFKSANASLILPDSDRRVRIDKCRQCVSFYNKENMELIPDDFYIVVAHTVNPLKTIFEQMELVLSLTYLSNTSFIDEDNMLKVQIHGQRNADYSYDLKTTLSYNYEFYKIYNWIYTDGNPTDKIIIARNIISLHCKFSDLLNIDQKTFASIQSNFSLYQKDNAVQYIELKNKLAGFLLSLISQTGEIVLGFSDHFKKNIIAFFTFLLTVFITNIVSDSKLNNIFTKDITLVTYLIFIGSCIFMYISKSELDYKLKKLTEGYSSLKESYHDLLDDNDIKNIFNDDIIYNENVNDVKKKRKQLLIIWSAFIVISFLIIDYLSEVSIIRNYLVHIFKILVGLINVIMKVLLMSKL